MSADKEHAIRYYACTDCSESAECYRLQKGGPRHLNLPRGDTGKASAGSLRITHVRRGSKPCGRQYFTSKTSAIRSPSSSRAYAAGGPLHAFPVHRTLSAC